MTSKVGICNIALARLGVPTITALSDNTLEARTCSTLFEDVVKEVSTEGCFSSTIRRSSLNNTGTTPAFDYTYEFQLPTNPKNLRVLCSNLEAEDSTYTIEGDKLLANVSTISIKYIAYLTDSGEYDEMLKRCIISRLAADLAYPLTGSQSTAQAMYQKYAQDMADAKAVDGQNGSNLQLVFGAFTEVR